MRKFLPIIAFVALIGCAAPLLAGPSIFAGVSVPTGDLADWWKLGFHGGVQYLYPVTPLGSIGIRGAYNRLAADEVGGVSYDGNFNMLEVLAVGQISLAAGPHFLAGLGMTRWDGEFGVTDSAAETDFTAVAGVGMTFVMFDVTALYHNIATEGNASSYFTLSAGLGF